MIAYGLTWIVCAILWQKLSPKHAALATLFQGMVAFPVAIGLSFAIGALGGDRPVEESITQLSIYIGTSQLLGLPFLIYLYTRQHYTLMPYAFAAICAMHFVLYSWLYQTPYYVVMSVVIALGGFIIMATSRSKSIDNSLPASRVCLFTGLSMLATVGAFQLL